MPSNIGAQLVKTLSFEVEAIPQDNAVELKKTTNMTPLNVKVRVRKKDDGSSLMRKGILSVPRNNQPDKPIEKLRLASSDQTIMSFDMVLEADLEKKASRKPKKHFFGICLGTQEDDDDAQYLPSTTSIDYDSRSDTGVTKLRNVRAVKPITDDVISSNSSRKKDKIFGKCKPGGCLDPPFGEDKYAYQPQPLRFKAPATTIDDAQAIDLQSQTSDKISVKKKQTVESAPEKVTDEQNQEKPILNLYQGESGTDIKENDSESIITYPTGISSSGLLLADEKNVARKTSGARNSRKSFNEFSSNEYFSPPRASRDSSKSDRENNLLTKELLSPRDKKTVSPTKLRHTVEKSGSKDFELFGTDNRQGLKDKNQEGNSTVGISDMNKDSIAQKPVLRTTSQGLISELFSDLENDSDGKTWNKTAAAAGIAAATTAGLVGIGLAANAKKGIVKPEDHKENPLKEDIQSKDIDNQRSDLGSKLPEGTSEDIKTGKRTSGARNSRKSFNEFSSNEYLIPPRASRDSSKSDREKNLLTKELLSPRDNKAVSPTRFRHSVEKSGSKDLELHGTDNRQGLKDKNHEGNSTVGISDMNKDSIVQKPVLRTTSQGLISELFSDLENDSDGKTWNKTAAAAGSAAATTAGLIGIGLAANAKEGIVKPEDHKENPLTEDIQSKDINNQRSDLGLKLPEGTSDDIKTDKSILLERISVDNSVNQGVMVGSKNINKISENQGEITPMRSQLQDSDYSFRGLETTRDSQRNVSHTGKSTGQNTGGQLASTGMEIIGDSQRNFTPLRHQMHDDIDEHRVPAEVYGDPTSGFQKTELKDNTIKSSEIDTTFEKDFSPVQGTENNGENIELIADTASKGLEGTFGPESGFQDTEKIPHSGVLEDFASSGMTIEAGSDTGYLQKNGEIYKGSKDKIAGTYDEALSLRNVMSEGMETGHESKSEIISSESERALKLPTVKSSNEIGTNKRPLRDLTPDELRLSESSHAIKHADATRESISSRATYRKISGNIDNDLLSQNQGLDGGNNDALSTKDGVDSFDRRIQLKGTKRTNDEQGAPWPKKSDTSVTDIIKSPSDIISKYRENKTLNQSPVGVDIQPTENTLEQAGRKLDGLGKWGSKDNKEGQFSSSVRVSPQDTSGRYSKNSVTGEHHGETDKTGSSHSRESIFLNLAFRTYLDENQRTVKTLDSSQDQDSDNVVLVKSLLRAQDKKGVTVPLDSKNIMNIAIKPIPPAQSHKSRPPKSISKFDSGKSDYSNSTISLKNIGSDPNAALSAILHHELVPLQRLIKSLKDEIDSLASQQMMLRNRLEIGTSKSKSFVTKKCGCPKKYLKY